MRFSRAPRALILAALCAVVAGLALASFCAGDAAANVDAAKSQLPDKIGHEHANLGGATARLSIVVDADELRIAPQPARAEPFEPLVTMTPEGPLWSKWRALSADLARDLSVLARCRDDMTACPPEARRLIAIADAARVKSGRALVGDVNRSVNLEIRFVSDLAHHGVADQWSSPLTTFVSGNGDCEDYAIAKYAALREAGVADDDLRLVIVRDQRARSDHAVLAVRQDDRWLVLDNRHFNLLDAGDMPDVVPLFTLGADGVQAIAAATDAPRARALRLTEKR